MDIAKPVKIGGELFWANWMNQYNTKFNEDNTNQYFSFYIFFQCGYTE